MVTHEDSFNNPKPLSMGNGFNYTAPDGANEERPIVSIGGSSAMSSQVKGQKGWSIEDNLTQDGIQWAGDHTIKMGANSTTPSTTRPSRTAFRTRRSS
ncbi:hypothetical protein G6F51_014526 [Rhizopus arrhizus]|uniref:Uncharacterized protein n=1 Tax=Rhizopus oryzae TaxID=64495 RepID=A0A9P7BY15_RHIOR|nr:hypothetical protein G6F51_014526 [Rhizopus arrhizus]